VASVAVWPVLITVGLADTTAAVRGGFTETVTALDVTRIEGDPVSLTCNSNDQVPTIVIGPDDMDTGDVHNEELPRLV